MTEKEIKKALARQKKLYEKFTSFLTDKEIDDLDELLELEIQLTSLDGR